MKLQRKNRLRALSLGAIAVSGALALTACGSDDTGGNTGGDASASKFDHELREEAETFEFEIEEEGNPGRVMGEVSQVRDDALRQGTG